MRLQLVKPATGLEWVKLGVTTFWRAPIALAALFFLSMAWVSLASMVPLVGTVLALALLPTISLIMMVGAAEVAHHRTPTPAIIWLILRGDRQRLQSLVLLGLCYALGFGALLFVSSMVDGGQFARIYLGMERLTPEVIQTSSFQNAMWTALLLYLPLSLTFWHAPALVHWHNTPALKSMFFSIVACTRNIGAFFMYGVGWMMMSFVTGAVLTLVTGLLSQVVGSGIMLLMLAAAMTLAAMFFTSVVFTFRDCFSAPQTTNPGTEGN